MTHSITVPHAEPEPFGRGTRMPDMVRFLAVLAARQRVLPTVQAMRGHCLVVGHEPADRMVRLFVSRDVGRFAGAGSFNMRTARFLTGTGQGEDGVYRGA